MRTICINPFEWMRSFVLWTLMAVFTFGAIETHAQKRRPAATEKDVILTLGQEYFENFANLPEGAQFRGDFKRVTSVAFSEAQQQFRFTPTKTGTATLTVHDANGQIVGKFLITVREVNLNRAYKEIYALLQEIEGIQVKLINNRVVIDGEVLLPRDLSRIASVIRQYGDSASSLVRLSPVSEKKIAEFIERDINNPEIHVRAVNGVFMLEGVAESDGEKQRASIIAQTYVPDAVNLSGPGVSQRKKEPVVNLITVRAAPAAEPSKMVQMVVHYVELNKDYSRSFGFSWAPTMAQGGSVDFNSGASGAAGGVVGQITGTISNLLPKLNWAREHGHARILKSTTLLVQDGKTGNINSTVARHINVVGAQGVPNLVKVDAGIKTRITPKILGSGSDSIDIQVAFEISNFLGENRGGITTSSNNVETQVIVRSSQSAAIGGLVSNASSTGYNRQPSSTAGSEDVLFNLLSSKAFRRDQSQFVVFITPVIKTSASAGSEQVKKKFRLRE